MSNDTALALIPRSIDEASSLSEQLSKATSLSDSMRGKPADVLACILAGREMGLAPMASLRLIHVIKSKPVLSADAMVAVVLGSGKAMYFRRGDATHESVTYTTQRVGAPEPQSCTWTIADARRAGLSGPNWIGYPRAMLAARAKSELARDVYPDVLAGCYDPDEAQSFAPSSEPPMPRRDDPTIIDAEVITSPVTVTDIEACETMGQLESLSAQLAGIARGPKRDELAAAYKQRRAEIQTASAA